MEDWICRTCECASPDVDYECSVCGESREVLEGNAGGQGLRSSSSSIPPPLESETASAKLLVGRHKWISGHFVIYGPDNKVLKSWTIDKNGRRHDETT